MGSLREANDLIDYVMENEYGKITPIALRDPLKVKFSTWYTDVLVFSY